jgi:AcrR family transcriptional regulator
VTVTPELTVRSGRAADIVVAARRILEAEGADALTMRRLAAEVGIRAPSLYKHFSTKRAVEAALIAEGLFEVGEILHAALAAPGRANPVRSLLEAYRNAAQASPAMYRLATSGRLPREDLPAGLEDWAGRPFFLATGDPWKAQALFSFAHGMVILELDERFPEGSDLGRTWDAGAAAFTG